MERLVGDFYELYYMLDYGTGSGECVALYACTRAMSRSPASVGVYLKCELYGVPANDPSRWWDYAYVRPLGLLRMFEWGDLTAMHSRI